jgi:uncharacterized protein (UPF0335 family)
MSERVVVHDQVHETIEEIAEDRQITMKEAVRDVFKEAGHNV